MDGSWWRVAGVLGVLILLSSIGTIGLLAAFDLWAGGLDLVVVSLLGSVVAYSFCNGFVALGTTLLFFDLRARQS